MVREVDDMEVRVAAASSFEIEREIGSKKCDDGDGGSAQALDGVRSHKREGEEGEARKRRRGGKGKEREGAVGWRREREKGGS